MEIYKEFMFESAHRLPNVEEGHKCGRLHGHSFKATIFVSGPVGETTGWVVDYSDMKKADPIPLRVTRFDDGSLPSNP